MKHLSTLKSLALCMSLLLAHHMVQAVTCAVNMQASNPDSDYTDNADGTVTHKPSGLVWKRCAEGQIWTGGTCSGSVATYTWSQALQQASASSFASKTDWRVPNIKELHSLVEECRSSPVINDSIFPGDSTGAFWSSSPHASKTNNAWYVNFSYGYTKYDNRTFSYPVRLVRSGLSSASFDSGGVISAPEGLGATAAGSAQINLSWTASANPGVTNYKIYRNASSTALATVQGQAVTSYSDTGLAGLTTYSYTVKACDAVGNCSAASAAVSATTAISAPVCTLVATPVAIETGASSTVSVSCTPAASSYAWTNTGFASTVTSGTVTPLVTTTYKVVGSNAAGAGSEASVTVAVNDTTPPSVPTGLAATVASSTQIDLTWNAATVGEGVVSYDVYRGGTLLKSLGNVTTYSDAGLTASSTYSYTLRACDAARNCSAQSKAVSVVTTAPVPACTLKATPSGEVEAGATITLSASCTPAATSYAWTNTGFSVTTASGTVSPKVDTTYTVVGSNASGSGSASMATLKVVVKDTTAPGVPTGLTLKVSGSSRIDISWTASVDNGEISAYHIYRGGVLLQSLGNVTRYSDTGLTKSTTYGYTVSACDAKGNCSAQSKEEKATTQTAATAVPVCTLNATPAVIAAGESVTLNVVCTPAATSYSWTPASADSDSVKVMPTASTRYKVTGKNEMGAGAEAGAEVHVCNTPVLPEAPKLMLESGVVLSGTSENNSALASTIGNDSIDGLAGIDTVVYQCNRDKFIIFKNPLGWSVFSSVDGMDTLTSVERIRFANQTLALDISGNAGQTYRIYQAAFNRTPDNGGLVYWIGRMDTGTSLEQVAAGFVDSAEFKTLYGENPSNTDFVVKLYNNVLHRAPDADGQKYWVGQLDKGMTKAAVLVAFSESPENQAGVLGAILNGIELQSTP